eukprot:6259059-Amphidinium_carterae.1
MSCQSQWLFHALPLCVITWTVQPALGVEMLTRGLSRLCKCTPDCPLEHCVIVIWSHPSDTSGKSCRIKYKAMFF